MKQSISTTISSPRASSPPSSSPLTPPFSFKTVLLASLDTKSNATKRINEISFSASSAIRVWVSLSCILGIPFFLHNFAPASTLIGNLQHVQNTWDALLKISSTLIASVVLPAVVYFGPFIMSQCPCEASSQAAKEGNDDECIEHTICCVVGSKAPRKAQRCFTRIRPFLTTIDGFATAMVLAVSVPLAITSSLPLLFPAWGWYPLAWFWYHVHPASEMAHVLEGICPHQNPRDIKLPTKPLLPSFLVGDNLPADATARSHLPLCLTESSWDALSAGALSSYNAKDVRTVVKGLQVAQHRGGLTVAIMARNVRDDLASLIDNMEGLAPFFKNLAVVIFENDSTDGTREAMQKWADFVEAEDRGYKVDIMECEEAPGCKLGTLHRDNDTGNYGKSKAVHNMDIYRQRMTDYIMTEYDTYSHMMVLDMDLAVSVSPLGILHSLGRHPDNAVASSGRMLFPTSFGTFALPYDLSAFRPFPTKTNAVILDIHERWCHIMPPGDRWRNSCHALDPFLWIELFRLDRGQGEDEDKDFYRVGSAFNGAVLYPLDLVRESHATYDGGDDGQRCEHIGFQYSLEKPVYVNRLWDMNIDPRQPGGPYGWRVQRIMNDVTIKFFPGAAMVLTHFISFGIFVYSMTMIGLFFVCPLIAPTRAVSKTIQTILTSQHRRHQRLQQGGKEEALFKMV